MSMFHELMMRKKGMPERYQEVEYIEVEGSQYIDTGVSGNALYNYEIEYQCVNSDDRVFLCGVDEGFSVKSSTFIRLPNSNFSWYYDTYATLLFNNPDYNTAKNKIEVLYDTNLNTVTTNVYNNETKINTTQRTIADVYNGNFYLGAINRNGSVVFDGKKRFYSAKFYNGTRLIRNFIPVYDTLTNKYGMWESVQGKFYGNAGTGAFKGSIVGYTIVGSPTITDGVVSGFNLSNYLQVPTDFNNNDFEIVLKLEDVGTDLLSRTIMRLQNADVTIGLTRENDLSLTNISGLIFNSGFNTNGILYVKFIQKGLNCSFGYSNDGTTYTMLNTILTEAISYVSPNRIMQSGNWGSIPVKLHIKDSYIKINNKLWFNGQPS